MIALFNTFNTDFCTQCVFNEQKVMQTQKQMQKQKHKQQTSRVTLSDAALNSKKSLLQMSLGAGSRSRAVSLYAGLPGIFARQTVARHL